MRDLERSGDRQRPAREPLGQRLALDQLHDENVPAAGFLHAVERGNVRVIQRLEHLRFALEPRRAVGVERPRLRQDLDRHLSPELRVARAIDLPHAAGAEAERTSYSQRRVPRVSPIYFVGTSRFSSSVQCCTTMICGGAAVWSVPPASLIIRNRCPSEAMSYVRPEVPPGIVK
jgi:hypothetical protein